MEGGRLRGRGLLGCLVATLCVMVGDDRKDEDSIKMSL